VPAHQSGPIQSGAMENPCKGRDPGNSGEIRRWIISDESMCGWLLIPAGMER
jgi:hypothetical protein